MKLCYSCSKIKKTGDFHKRIDAKDGLRNECKSCRLSKAATYYNASERKLQVTNYVKTRQEQRRAIQLRYEYGISVETYAQLLLQQGDVCAICKKPESKRNSKYLCVDHDHFTGNIRGLLCHNCNSAIGKLGDSTILLKAAVRYLEQSCP